MIAAKNGLARPFTTDEFSRKAGEKSHVLVAGDLWLFASPLGGAQEVYWCSEEHFSCETLRHDSKPS